MKGLAIATLIAFCGLLAVARGQSVVEVYIAVDNKVKEYYRTSGTPTSKIKEDVAFLMKEVNDIYKNTNLGLELRTAKIDVLNSDIFTNIQTQNAVYGDNELQNWKNYLNRGASFSNYDVGMLLTGYDLVGNDGSRAMVGIATVKSICLKSAATLVEFKGLAASAMVAAHEIGHILGLEHDDTHTTCPDGYIMSSIHRTDKRSKFDFSSCSIRELRSLISGKNCLSRQQTTASAISDRARPSPQYYVPDTMCKKYMNNKDGKLCMATNLYNGKAPQGDLLCQRIYCGLPGVSTCSLHDSSDLMVCGPGKRCNRGRCLTAPSDLPVSPSITSDDCLFGESSSINVKTSAGTVQMTCPNYVANNRGQCSQSYVKTTCCESCNSGHIGTRTTRAPNTQRPGSCRNGYVRNINTNNCVRCNGDSSISINGVATTCSAFIRSNPIRCNDPQTTSACCQTCANTRQVSATTSSPRITNSGSCSSGYVRNVNTGNCEFCQGDYTNLVVNSQQTTCSQYVRNNPRSCNQNNLKSACCATCAKTRIGLTNNRCSGSDHSICTSLDRNTACSQFPTSCCNLCSLFQFDKRDNPEEDTIVMDTAAIGGDFRVDY